MKLGKWWFMKLVKWTMVEAMLVYANTVLYKHHHFVYEQNQWRNKIILNVLNLLLKVLTDVRISIIQYNYCQLILQVTTERHLFQVYYQDGNDLLWVYVHCEMKPLFVHSVFLQYFIITYWISFPYSLIKWKYVINQKIASVS